MNIYLEIPEYASHALRARLSYAFRLFCAIYGHRPILEPADAVHSEVAIRYRGAAGAALAGIPTVWLCRGLRERDPRQPAPPPIKYARHGIGTMLHYAPENGNPPDWIGEIFEWVSCADEYSLTQRDRIGRPLLAATYAIRHGIDTRVPYAALAMRALQQEICKLRPRAGEKPCPPANLSGHAVIPTHDVDYFPAGRSRAVRRLLRNAAISSLLEKRPGLALRQAAQALKVALGSNRDPLDQIVNVADRELRMGLASSFYFLVRSAHRRDAGYDITDPDVQETVRWLKTRGMEIGLHASFTSLEQPGELEQERNRLEAGGIPPLGGRQHWLRFTLDRLIPEVEAAGLGYDASIGWSSRIGFRAGACFAYPPYDFANERPANFLEFPLVVMDQALCALSGRQESHYQEVAQMIATSRRWGWGGISLLWHPAAFGGAWLPADVGETYWRLAAERSRCNDLWMQGAQFLEVARRRYVEAGLLAAETPLPVARHQPRPALIAKHGRARPQPVAAMEKALSA